MTQAEAKATCDLFYLALVVWREARGASRAAQIAVAHSVLNRVAKPSWWGKTIDEVITKKWQYSSIAAPGDPQLILWPKISDSSWRDCLDVADDVLKGIVPNPFPGADSYYDSSIAPPKWAVDSAFRGEVASPKGNTLRFFDVDSDYDATL